MGKSGFTPLETKRERMRSEGPEGENEGMVREGERSRREGRGEEREKGKERRKGERDEKWIGTRNSSVTLVYITLMVSAKQTFTCM